MLVCATGGGGGAGGKRIGGSAGLLAPPKSGEAESAWVGQLSTPLEAQDDPFPPLAFFLESQWLFELPPLESQLVVSHFFLSSIHGTDRSGAVNWTPMPLMDASKNEATSSLDTTMGVSSTSANICLTQFSIVVWSNFSGRASKTPWNLALDCEAGDAATAATSVKMDPY